VPTGVAAVVVTYEPELPRFLAALAVTLAQVDRVVVVDNGSREQDRLAAQLAGVQGVETVLLADNLGVAAALNHGVRRLAAGEHDFVLTLDQDTVLHEGAVATVLGAFNKLDATERGRCGVLAMAHRPPRRWPSIADPGSWAGSGVEEGEGFRRRRLLITSGNLVRRVVAETVPYEESLFVDQVDFAFSLAVRAHGWSLLEYTTVLMDHPVGQLLEAGGRTWRYEHGQRLYYIVRNSTWLVLRSRLPASVYVMQLATWARAYLHVNGSMALPRLAAVVALGLADGVRGRLGRRSYALLAEPARRRATALGPEAGSGTRPERLDQAR
jgi:rhamnosyltransferase